MAKRSGQGTIREKGGLLRKGKIIGHADASGRVRERDGLLFKGNTLGYVDERHRVRRKSGMLKKDEIVGRIRKDVLYGPSKFLRPAPQLGHVDKYGNVWLDVGRARVVGRVKGENHEQALAYFLLRYGKLESDLAALEQSVAEAEHPYTMLPVVRDTLSSLQNADAIGDLDVLVARALVLEEQCVASLAEELLGSPEKSSLLERIRNRSLTIQDFQAAWNGNAQHTREQFEDLLLEAKGTIESMAGQSVDFVVAEMRRVRMNPSIKVDEYWDLANTLLKNVVQLRPRESLNSSKIANSANAIRRRVARITAMPRVPFLRRRPRDEDKEEP
ncbi:MAG: hypothetical protein R3A47_04065 [Polyangiales bacterium]